MFCVKTPGTEVLCKYALCEDYDVETDECLYNEFPMWMRQLPNELKHNKELKKFSSIGALAEEYLKVTVR